jgi:soluble lytic murein transglycosylase-like protein
MGDRYRDAKTIVAKWAFMSRLPQTTVLAIMSHESGYNPNAVADSGGDAKRGNAYGLMQMTAETAPGVIRDLEGIKLPSIVATLAKWNPANPASLLDPELNVLVGVGYLNQLMKAFHNDADMAIAGYNRGRAGAAKILAEKGKEGILQLPYVQGVKQIRKQLEETPNGQST